MGRERDEHRERNRKKKTDGKIKKRRGKKNKRERG